MFDDITGRPIGVDERLHLEWRSQDHDCCHWHLANHCPWQPERSILRLLEEVSCDKEPQGMSIRILLDGNCDQVG